MEGLNLHWGSVPDGVASLLRRLSPVLRGTDFYLAGGTALALYEGHRVSEDLDLFSQSFSDPERLLGSVDSALGGGVATLVTERTLYVQVEGLTASFFGYAYPTLEPPLRAEPDLVPLAQRDDIAAMKLAAIASRGSRKDFVDIWTLISRHRPLREYLDRYREKFVNHDVGHVVRSLTYFDDAEREPPLRLLVDIEWSRVKSDLTRWTMELLDR